MLFGLLTGILVVTHMIPLLLVIAAILWIVLLLFEKIVSFVSGLLKSSSSTQSLGSANNKQSVDHSEATGAILLPGSPSTGKSKSVLGASKTRITPKVAPVLVEPQPADQLLVDSKLPNQAGQSAEGNESTSSVAGSYNNDEPDDEPDVDDNMSEDDDDVEDDDETDDQNVDEEEEEPDFDEPDDATHIPATMASQLPAPPAIEYEPLQMDPDAVQHYPLSSLEPAQDDPPAQPVEQYARRLKTVRTAAFDIARVVRNRQRNQSPEQLATQFLGLIEHYQLLADMNVKRIIDQAHERSRQTYDEHIKLFFRIQNACISGELEPAEDESDDEREGNHD